MFFVWTLDYGINLAIAIIVVVYLAVYFYRNHKQGAQMGVFSWLKVVEQVAPVLLAVVPGVPPVLVPFVIKGIQSAELVEGATGPQKLAIAVQEVNNGVAALNTVRPGTVDPNAVNDAVVNGINTVVSTVNVVQSTHQTSTPPKA